VAGTDDSRSLPDLPARSWSAAIFGWPIDFLAAVQFLTIVPPVVRRPFTPSELGRAVGWYAAVGLFLGASLAAVDTTVGLLFPPGVTAALVLVVWVLATGALHLDGFLDSCDGLFGGRTPEARLRIMRDERAGAFAVVGAVLLILVKYVCLAGLPDRTAAVIIAPALGRGAMALAVVAFPYARAEGLGRAVKDHAGWAQAALAAATAFLAAVAIAHWSGAIAFGLTVVLTAAVAAFVLRRLPGLTGDIYGAVCELAEVAALLTLVAGTKP
jgi:adenosylcobinamide-GDP ribazoletransferase